MPDRVVADRYVLEAVLGRGGAGTVWRARDTLLDRVVAVKEVVVPPAAADRDDLRTRVLREARAAARLTHPNVVRVYDVAADRERVHIVMELVPAPSLDALVRREGPLAPAAAAEIGLDVLDALEAAAREGIVHRDVKPGNVILDGGGAKLADFGIASLRDDPSITASGTVLGSPAYMAPEQARGERSGPAADLWALGATLYYAVEGVGPFDRDGGALPTLTAVVHETPRPPVRADALAPVLEALLDKDPARRPAGRALREALEDAAGDRSTEREPAPAAAGSSTGRQRFAIAAAVVALAGAGAAAALLPGGEEPSDGEAAAPAGSATDPQPAPGGADDPVRGEEADEDDGAGDETGAVPANPPDEAPEAAEPSAVEPPAAEPPAADAAADERGDDADASVPGDWQPYTDPDTGYEIAHPPDWEIVEVSDTLTDFRDPDSSRYLRVDWAEEPVHPPTAAWEEMSASFAATKADYEEVRLDATTYQGHDAAEWEYRYTEGGVRLHGIDLGIAAPDHGYALNFVTTEDDWEAAQPQFEAFKAAFVLPVAS